MVFVVEKWNEKMLPDDRVPTDRSFILDCEEGNRRLALACVCLASCYFSSNFDKIAEHLKQLNGPFYYARQYWFGHLEAVGVNWTPILWNFESLADTMKLAYGCLKRYAHELMLAKEEAAALTKSLRDATDFASKCIKQGDLFCSS